MRPIFNVFIALVFLISMLPSATTLAANNSNNSGNREYSSDFSQLKRFSQVYDIVKRYYVRDISDDELMEGALKGMLYNLDPHSSFLNVKEYKEMRENTAGEFFGVGIEISNENGQVIVVSPIEDTPAHKAGIKAGDIILAVDGVPTQDMGPQEVVGKIRGPKDTEVELLLLSKGSRAPFTLRIKRDAIPVISVKAKFIDDGYLLLRLTRFSERSTQELKAALSDSRKKSEVKGIILDLRNNPGGLLDQAVSVSDMFLGDGVIVSMRGRENKTGMEASFAAAFQEREFKASANKNDVTEPVVVLVNSGSASAAEIVAGALQDRRRAVLLGEKTFGKGSVQQIIPIDGGSAIKITTALYYTPSGRSIQAEGIEPDLFIPFEITNGNGEEDSFPRIREKDLSRHLENATVDRKSGKVKNAVDEDAPAMLAADNQLRTALQVVKSLPVIQRLGTNP